MKNSIIPFYKQTDKLIVKSKDCYLYDSDNRQYIDQEVDFMPGKVIDNSF